MHGTKLINEHMHISKHARDHALIRQLFLCSAVCDSKQTHAWMHGGSACSYRQVQVAADSSTASSAVAAAAGVGSCM
jgi:hypothetical protein